MGLGLGAEHRLSEVVRELLVRVDRVVVRSEDRDLPRPKTEIHGRRMNKERAQAVPDDGNHRIPRR